MRWVHFFIIVATLHGALSDDANGDSNEISPPTTNLNLDSNLRKALLKALTELENDDSNRTQDGAKENIIEKASASSVSIFANGDSVTVSPVSSTTTAATTITTTPETVTVVFQKSQSNEQPPITIIEPEKESILTSASSNFINQPFGKESQSEKNDKNVNQNSIYDEKFSAKSQKIITTTPRVTTEESEAKVENVQFFSAPLVAAFTVHQDEAGQPKKVEPIFKTVPTKSQEQLLYEKEEQIKLAKQREEALLRQQQQEKIRLEEYRRQQEKLEFQQKQKALEEQIYRLNLSLRQQQQIFLKQQEDLRLRNNAQTFTPITERPLINQAQQLPFPVQQQTFNQQFKPIQQNQFNPILDANKLPANAQFLPVKGPVDFRTPFNTNTFNNNNFNQLRTTNFNQNFNQQRQQDKKFIPLNNNFNNNNNNNFNQQAQSNRVFRQNTGVGNFGFNQDFNRNNNNFNKNTNSFSIQPAISFDNPVQSNRFFRSNLESSLTAPQSTFLQPPSPQPAHNPRFFRANLEASFTSPPNDFFQPSISNNHQLNNLLYNSGAFRGKSQDDLSLISKVLSLNHQSGNGLSLRPELRQQFGRNF